MRIRNTPEIVAVGFAAGVMQFLVVEPYLFNVRGLILQPEYIYHLLLLTYPLLVVPFVVVAANISGQEGSRSVFLAGFLAAFTAMWPVPTLDYWLRAPRIYMNGYFSQEILFEVAWLTVWIGGLSTLAAFIGYLAACLLPGRKQAK